MSDVTLIMTDYGSQKCGVADTVTSWMKSRGHHPTIIDARSRRKTIWTLLKEIPHNQRVIFVYPTASGRANPTILLILAQMLLARHSVDVYLHEFRRLQALHRAFVYVALFLTRGPIVVSTWSEQQYVASRSFLGQRSVKVVPAPAGAAPTGLHTPEHSSRPPHHPLTAGVFGIPRRDKALPGLWSVLRALGAQTGGITVDLVGHGWLGYALPSLGESVRFNVLGFVPTSDLPEIITRWDFALAPFSDGATDGRNSYRTPCMYGVPVFTTPPQDPRDCTFRSNHIRNISELLTNTPTPLEADAVSALAQASLDFEISVRGRLDEAFQLRGVVPLGTMGQEQ